MKVLVTGATGFVGYAVAARLVELGHEVDGLTRSPSAPLPDGVRRMRGDLTSAEQLQLVSALTAVDGVCHLAGRTRVRESWADPLGYWHTNVGGTLALLSAMLTAGTERLVLASTCSVYSERAEQPISEAAPTVPSNPYGRSKLAADHAATDLAATGVLGAVSLRAFNIAGAVPRRPDRDNTRLIPRLLAVQQGAESELVINGDGSAIRDFVHVADMATAFALALEASTPGAVRIYNVGSGHATRVRDVISTVERVTGRRVPRRCAPAAQEPPELIAESTLIRSELGWRPEHSSVLEIVTDAWGALGGN